MMMERLEQLKPFDIAWFRRGYEEMLNLKAFNPPNEMDAASSYLSGWIEALNDMRHSVDPLQK
jgi:hypothetical protein